MLFSGTWAWWVLDGDAGGIGNQHRNWLGNSLVQRKVKFMHKSRTMWFSLLLVVFGALMDNFSYVQNIIDPKYYGVCLISIGIIVAILRFVTTEPIK